MTETSESGPENLPTLHCPLFHVVFASKGQPFKERISRGVDLIKLCLIIMPLILKKS